MMLRPIRPKPLLATVAAIYDSLLAPISGGADWSNRWESPSLRLRD
jgi:hypothetical protein